MIEQVFKDVAIREGFTDFVSNIRCIRRLPGTLPETESKVQFINEMLPGTAACGQLLLQDFLHLLMGYSQQVLDVRLNVSFLILFLILEAAISCACLRPKDSLRQGRACSASRLIL
mmetsp:Transcript_118502/g.347140  ORF Transcript_118502/g.347140 Transcript_118502/m.347140 type:complete len:116 (+) Transcript_118502:1449-1796(+)